MNGVNTRILRVLLGLAAVASTSCQVAAPTTPSSTQAPAAVATQQVATAKNSDEREILRAPSPDRWRLVTQINRGDTRLLEYAPPADSPIADDEQLKLESFRRDPALDPHTFLSNIAREFRQQCPGAAVHDIISKSENGYPVQVTLLICNDATDPAEKNPAANKARPPLQMVKAIQGEDWFYVVSRSSRAPTTADTFAALKPRIAAWLLYLGGISLCAADAPEHPCAALPAQPIGPQADHR